MKTLILLFHPNITESRVNKRLIDELKKQDVPNVTVRDEYSVYPDGKIDVGYEQKLVEENDRIIFQFPLYWYSSPSLLKKWEDRVLLYGWAYGTDGDVLANKQLSLAISAGSPDESYHPYGAFGQTMDAIIAPFMATSRFVGAEFAKPFITTGVTNGLDDTQLAKRAAQYVQYIKAEQ
ncbi:NAD(P)H-dependent oxidoreductase [Lactobacillus sp. Sy-1]|uniref:NAD(P)H-dependent oxidoreductase n=1 Tax=Lactobacillus sp. Sy-1 TaxID=2109645 RepID=UPI001C5AE41F|nr:NAD(P)H-dependent oxidoreductase [Lactobacillus sp. Sy-1]MBW1606171.1 NAD(P)H-dependent oxidoreductase [Lactobacillus sp. Sy-1]